MGAINFHEKDAGTNHRGEGGLQKVTTNQSPHRPFPPASPTKAKSLLPPVLVPGPRFSSLGPAAATKIHCNCIASEPVTATVPRV